MADTTADAVGLMEMKGRGYQRMRSGEKLSRENGGANKN
jgi:hypothetical protein